MSIPAGVYPAVLRGRDKNQSAIIRLIRSIRVLLLMEHG